MRRAFTLIELLVVIAIIAILLALTLPALGGARTASKQVKALANGRSVAQSFGLYLNDYDETYPYVRPGEGDGGFGGLQGVMLFEWYPKGTIVGVSPPFEALTWAWPAVLRHVAPWEENYAVWVSPGMGTSPPTNEGLGKNHEPMEDISWRYSTNFVGDPSLWSGSGRDDPDLFRAVRQNEVQFGAGKVLLWDTHLAYLRDEPELVEGHWNAKTPMAFADEHAEARNPLDAKAGVTNPLTGSDVRLHNTPDGVRGIDY